MAETFDLSVEQARAYEDLFVPALFAQWVPTLLGLAGVSPGQDVLDVACGTGVVARRAADLVGPTGRSSGVDLNPAMIAVARERSFAVDWQVGDAEDLPYDDGSFDAVVCQSALFFFPDPSRALAEMARVLRAGGAVALQTYAGLPEQPAYGPFVQVVARHAGEEARTLLGTYWSMGDLSQLTTLLRAARLEPTSSDSMLGHVRFPSLEAFVRTEIEATPLATRIDGPTFRAVVRDARTALHGREQPDGSVDLPIRACFVAARKAAASSSERRR